MTLNDYLYHYLQIPYILLMLFSSVAVIGICLAILNYVIKKRALQYTPETRPLFIRKEGDGLIERFYELIFSATSILLFVGIYFLIDFFGIGTYNSDFWARYNSLILLGFILTSVTLISVVDNFIIPLNNMRPNERASMRLIGMLYMLIVFAYIKFIYDDSNYDSIILYFLTLVIGRFVYFDASVQSFHNAVLDASRHLSLLLLALFCTGVMAFVGFTSGYLLRSNGVVLNLFLAHLYLMLVIFVIHHTQMFLRKKRERRTPGRRA
ncbi:MAG: hypothetical protein Q4B57_06320 [Eubacteriales bacterium]|nr:hypothetical protein [Eubacteriales bacterium]